MGTQLEASKVLWVTGFCLLLVPKPKTKLCLRNIQPGPSHRL